MNRYPKRLIEVDLPIKRISAHARRDKNIRKGHLHTMHAWWAAKPLAACRAVLCASLWPDPADELCPDSFRGKTRSLMQQWANKNLKLLSAESLTRFVSYQKDPTKLENNEELRKALLDFIADFANWDNSTVKEYLETSRELTQAAHEALGGEPGTKPLVIDPFAGTGSIPFEALRIGCQSFASDLNPVAILLNKVALEYLPSYGRTLFEYVRKWGKWLKEQSNKELRRFYPTEPDGGIPLAYIYARTIQCEGPGCGFDVPLLGLLWLSQKDKIALRYIANKTKKEVEFEIFEAQSERDIQPLIVRRFSATCPICGYTTPYKSVREQLRKRKGGAQDARLLAVITLQPNGSRAYRLATSKDLEITHLAREELKLLQTNYQESLSLWPNEPTPECRGPGASRAFSLRRYGISVWGDLYTSRQTLTLCTYSKLIRQSYYEILKEDSDSTIACATSTCLALALSNLSHYLSSLSIYTLDHMISAFVQGSGLAMRPNFAEANPLIPKLVGGFEYALGQILHVLNHEGDVGMFRGTVQQCSATNIPLPNDSAASVVTDPPYYDAVPYADLSDFFYVWLKRAIGNLYPDLFQWPVTPKSEECVLDPGPRPKGELNKDKEYFEKTMEQALADSRRVVQPDGVAVVIFAHKTTAGWEALLNALINAGWKIIASWPIDTERGARLRANNSAVLASSIHLVCRPNENPDGSLITDYVGDWREVLQELPKRIHEWMPRLAREGVVGADAIFSCLGPALEIFSQYSYVEKASGEKVALKEYLEHVWAAVAKEALNMIFEGADTAGFEEDSRLTAMWLWTLSTGANGNGPKETADEKTAKSVGYTLEFDAARKIAQGLGAHLEKLGRMVEIKGNKARLLSVAERTKYLFGKEESQAPVGRRKKKDSQMQLDFMAEVQKAEREEGGWGEKNAPRAGETMLDQLHQAMILFAAGRGEAMKRFLVEEGIGRDGRFWRLAQALSALYPTGTDEKRWVDGVLARKKGLGF